MSTMLLEPQWCKAAIDALNNNLLDVVTIFTIIQTEMRDSGMDISNSNSHPACILFASIICDLVGYKEMDYAKAYDYCESVANKGNNL